MAKKSRRSASKSASKSSKQMNKVHMTSWILCTVAALNIGLVQFLNYDVLGMVPGAIGTLLYALIGLSGVYSLYMLFTCKK